MNWPSKIINDINSILLPPLCFGCTVKLSRGENLLCTVCRHDLPLTEYNYTQENAVDRIFYGRVRIEKAASLLYFTTPGIVKNLLHYLKYKNQKEIGSFLGNWFGTQLRNEQVLQVDMVIPVPLHPKKQKKRGYNQVTNFGNALAKQLETSFEEDILQKTRHTKTQTKKKRMARTSDEAALYVVSQPTRIKNKSILLVDDVITTGATLEACAKALQKAENVKIYIATMAFVP